MGLFGKKKDVYGIPGYYECERPSDEPDDASRKANVDQPFVLGDLTEREPKEAEKDNPFTMDFMEPKAQAVVREVDGEIEPSGADELSVDEETNKDIEKNEEEMKMSDNTKYPEVNKGTLKRVYRYWPADPQNVAGSNKWQFAEDEASAKQAGANYEPVWVWDRGGGARITPKDMLTPDEIRLYAP